MHPVVRCSTPSCCPWLSCGGAALSCSLCTCCVCSPLWCCCSSGPAAAGRGDGLSQPERTQRWRPPLWPHLRTQQGRRVSRYRGDNAVNQDCPHQGSVIDLWSSSKLDTGTSTCFDSVVTKFSCARVRTFKHKESLHSFLLDCQVLLLGHWLAERHYWCSVTLWFIFYAHNVIAASLIVSRLLALECLCVLLKMMIMMIKNVFVPFPCWGLD